MTMKDQDQRYGLGGKGQGQIFLKSVLQLIMGTFILMVGDFIQHNDHLWYVDDNEGFRYTLNLPYDSLVLM